MNTANWKGMHTQQQRQGEHFFSLGRQCEEEEEEEETKCSS